MKARLLHLTLVSEMSISPDGLLAKLAHAAPFSGPLTFLIFETGTLCRSLSILLDCRSAYLLNIFTLGGEQEQTWIHS